MAHASSPLKPLLNRGEDGAYQLPADGKFQIVPAGTAPNKLSGAPVLQVVDARSLELQLADLLNRASSGESEMLVDFDHESRSPDKSTKAAGWIQLATAEKRADGIYSEIRLTNAGRESLLGGDFRFGSPEFDPATVERIGGADIRPTRLVGFALTNRNNFRSAAPLSNNEQTTAQNPMDPRKLLLNILQCEDTDAAIASAAAAAPGLIEAGKRVAALETEVAELKNREAAAILETYKGRVPDTEEFKKSATELLLTNRAAALALLETSAPSEASKKLAENASRTPLYNRAAAKPAKVDFGADPGDRMVLINRAVAAIVGEQKITREAAFAVAKQRNPELFADPS